MNTNNIDHQPHWDELLSQTELRRIREENKWNHIQQQQPKKKRRCCGNRKLQRVRKACRAKGLTEQRIKMLIEMRQPLERNIDNINRQDDASTWNSNHTINISMNKNQNQFNKCQTTRMIPSSTSIHPMKVHYLSKEDWRQSSKLITDCPRIHLNTCIQLLKCVQRLANLWCHFFQLKIEEDYWNYLDNLHLLVMVWLSEDVSKEIIQQNSIDWDSRRTKTSIRHQKTLIQNKLQRTEYNLSKHQSQLSSKFNLQNEIYVKNSIDIVFKTFAIILQNDFNSFHVHFEQKKLLLHFNFHDAYLLKSFYDLNPTEKQINLVQQIWQTKLNSCERLLREKTKTIFPDNNPIVNMNLLSIDDFVPVMFVIIEARLITIEQRTQFIMEFIKTPSL
ncbi:unnamed protein product [Rotaria magnacalcarata]|uniref:Uncharacterized protein n=1 Tax=Rotaria magnacalcarata TaxID=392030 RepID=A0A814PSM6_9BILA|nr:unnamed protein product [Rotaria magnacalcarata]CAF4113324.1 unnamed protein product [Rotaria magnacalcarata]